MTLHQLPPQARPREKLLDRGPAALADAELLALLLRTGPAGRGVLGLAQTLLDRFQGLGGLMHARPDQLLQVEGIGPAKGAELAAVMEIARRAVAAELRARPLLDAPAKVKEWLKLQMAGLPHEEFAVLLLDSQHRLMAWRTLFRGTLGQTSVYPREVVKEALDHGAAAVVFAHNHPSGHAEPSRADEHLTQALQAALRLVDVRVLDHLVVGRGEVVSMAERGLL